jgi:hypothetical protein
VTKPLESGRQPDGPDGRLSAHEFERIIRRAAELQGRQTDAVAGGVTEADALRIGRLLGLSLDSLQRAIGETSGGTAGDSGMLARVFGPETVRAARVLRGEPAGMAASVERYLVECEYLAVVRRFGSRVLFTRATGVPAAVGRAATRLFNRSRLLRVTNLEMTVQPLEDGCCYVSVATSLRGERIATVTSSLIGGGAGTAVAAAALVSTVAPPAAVLAAPVLGLGVAGGRAIYRAIAGRVQLQLEGLLDRVEHDDLPRSVWSVLRR